MPDVVWAAIDPGPASLELAKALTPSPARRTPPLLAVSGSATALTRRQLAALVAQRGARLVKAVGAPVPDAARSAQAVAAALAEAGAGDVVLLATVVDAADVVPLTPGQAAAVPAALGQAVAQAITAGSIGGLYTTGGDVTAAVLDAIGGRGIAVEGEVLPLAVSGRVVGGPHDRLPIVTKGGLIGDDHAAVTCLDHLATVARPRRPAASAVAARL
jgi:uncharacterized protein YgbK (DUF1537 family)